MFTSNAEGSSHEAAATSSSSKSSKSLERFRRRSQLQQPPPQEEPSTQFDAWFGTVEQRNEEACEGGGINNKNHHQGGGGPAVIESVNSRENVPSDDVASSSTLANLFGVGTDAKKQRKIVYQKFGVDPIKLLEVVSEDGIPEPTSERDVIIKVAASTVSYSDCMLRRGHNMHSVSDPISLPATPGGDVVGNIVKVGIHVKQFAVGDRVASLVRTGGNARYISVPAMNLVQVPRTCDAAEAACMVSTFMTAYQAVRLVTKDQFTMNGKNVLITGGIEPVGQALIQLCFRAGAEQVYTTAPANRHKYIQSVLGAYPLPVNPQDWLPKTKGLMDVVFDGKCHDGLDSAYASLKEDGGILVCVGMSALLGREQHPGVFGAPLSAYWTQLKGQLLLSNSKTYEVWESFKEDREAFKLDLEILLHLLKKRFIKPHIAKRVALSDVAEAHDSLEKENVRGQIVCIPWKRSALGK